MMLSAPLSEFAATRSTRPPRPPPGRPGKRRQSARHSEQQRGGVMASTDQACGPGAPVRKASTTTTGTRTAMSSAGASSARRRSGAGWMSATAPTTRTEQFSLYRYPGLATVIRAHGQARKSARGGRVMAVSTKPEISQEPTKEHNVTIHQRRGRHHAGYRLASLLRKRQPRRAKGVTGRSSAVLGQRRAQSRLAEGSDDKSRLGINLTADAPSRHPDPASPLSRDRVSTSGRLGTTRSANLQRSAVGSIRHLRRVARPMPCRHCAAMPRGRRHPENRSRSGGCQAPADQVQAQRSLPGTRSRSHFARSARERVQPCLDPRLHVGGQGVSVLGCHALERGYVSLDCGAFWCVLELRQHGPQQGQQDVEHGASPKHVDVRVRVR